MILLILIILIILTIVYRNETPLPAFLRIAWGVCIGMGTAAIIIFLLIQIVALNP